MTHTETINKMKRIMNYLNGADGGKHDQHISIADQDAAAIICNLIVSMR